MNYEEMVREINRKLEAMGGLMPYRVRSPDEIDEENRRLDALKEERKRRREKENLRNSCDECYRETTHYYRIKRFRHDGLYGKIKEDGWSLCLECLKEQTWKDKGDTNE